MRFSIITGNEFKTVQRTFNKLKKKSLEGSFVNSLVEQINFRMIEFHAEINLDCDILIVEDDVEYIIEYFKVFSDEKYNGGYKDLNFVACTKAVALSHIIHRINISNNIKLIILDVDLGETQEKDDDAYLSKLKSRVRIIQNVVKHKYKIYVITQFENDTNLKKTVNWLRSKGFDTFGKCTYFDRSIGDDLEPTSDNYIAKINEKQDEIMMRLGHMYKNAVAFHNTDTVLSEKTQKEIIINNLNPIHKLCDDKIGSDPMLASNFVKRLNDGSKAIYDIGTAELRNTDMETLKGLFAGKVEKTTKKENGLYYKTFGSLSQEVKKHRQCIGSVLDRKFHLETSDVKYLYWMLDTFYIYPNVKKNWNFYNFDKNELNSLSSNKREK